MTQPEKRLVLLGAGGHAKVVAETAQAAGWRVVGFLDPGRPPGSLVVGAPVLGDGGDLSAHPELLADCAFFAAVGDGRVRWREHLRLKAAGASVATLVHPAAILSPSCRLGAGSVVMAGAVVQAETWIGEAAIVNTGARVDHDCRIGDAAMIAPGAVLCGGVRVGEGAFLAAGSLVAPGLRIGAGAFVGIGTAVVEDLGDGGKLKATRRRAASGSIGP